MATQTIALGEILDRLTVEGELYEKLDNDAVRCYACGHRCLIKAGREGICRVRYNQGGKLYVPHGYVGALQIDPTEKKPFFHVLPGSNTLTFGMLGCDLHCSYCFTGDTFVVTDRGPLALSDAFNLASRFERTHVAEIAYPGDLRAVAASGTLRRVRAVFKHTYRGQLAVIRPYYLSELRCTPDHRVYATDDVVRAPEPIQAQKLTERHYLAIPRRYILSSPHLAQLLTAPSYDSWLGQPDYAPAGATGSLVAEKTMKLTAQIAVTDDYYLVPIRAISWVEHAGDVYNLEVEDEHNYLAGFFLVSNCQNWQTSQTLRDKNAGVTPQPVTPEELVQLGQRYGAQLFGSSYNEPLITSEWAVAVFKQAQAAGFRCLYISNGNATPEVLDYIRPYVVGYKIDLKSMNDKNYRKLGAELNRILDGIKLVHERGFWLEIVTLTIPGFNDSNAELWDAARFIAALSPDIPWHVTAFHQDYKMTDPDNTDVQTLLRAAEIGQEAGLRYVYAGNLPGQVGSYENTYCPNCHELLIARGGYRILKNVLSGSGLCPKCGATIPGIWS
ncbi:MAG TPA: radical SAM protein [Anaerolineae bacterium]|nr:radical SAM protein [Anaerolineae bacterium]